MALTIYLIMAFIAATTNTNAKFVWQDDDPFENRGRRFNTFPTFPTFPQFAFPTFPPMNFPSASDIARHRGKNYNGVAVSSSSSSTIDKDGKVIKTGGATFLSNEDGNVKELKFGDTPPNIYVTPPFVTFPQMSMFWNPFDQFESKMDPEFWKTYKPGKDEHFVSKSSTSYSKSSNVNGVKSSSSGINVVSNVDGSVDEILLHNAEENKV